LGRNQTFQGVQRGFNTGLDRNFQRPIVFFGVQASALAFHHGIKHATQTEHVGFETVRATGCNFPVIQLS